MNELRRASTVCLVRDTDELQVLMVQRPHASRFMPSSWVFPGGAVDDVDMGVQSTYGTGDDWVVAAMRELIEETGLWITTDGVIQEPLTNNASEAVARSSLTLAPDALVYFSNWITPRAFPLRFDTRFYLAVGSEGVDGAVDGDELVDIEWINPLKALDREQEGSWEIAFPTRKTLELLGSRGSAATLMDLMLSRPTVQPVEPRLLVTDVEVQILMPEDDLFAAVEADQNDPEIMHRLAAVIARGGDLPAELRRRS